MATVEIKLDATAFAATEEQVRRAALKAMEAVKTDLSKAQTVPRDTGKLEESISTDLFAGGDEIHATLGKGSVPYARYIYSHPEYNFQKANNPNAGALWMEPYGAGGEKESLVRDTFAAALKEAMSK